MIIKNTAQLPGEIREVVISYIRDFLAVHKDNLRSVLVYGSAAGRGYTHRLSDVNLVFIFRELPFETFQDSLRLVSRGFKKKISAPLFFDESMIRSSLDVFPLEYLEMKENSVLLYGEDLFSSIEIKGGNLRLFCEREIKGKLIKLQQAYLEVGSQPGKLKDLLRVLFKNLIPTFRALIRLKGQKPSLEKKNDIETMVKLFGLNEIIFSSLYNKILKPSKLNPGETLSLFKDFWSEMKKIFQKIDGL